MASGTVTLHGYLGAGNYQITANGLYTSNIPIYGNTVPENVVIKTARIQLELRNPGYNTIYFNAIESNNRSTKIGEMGVGGTGGVRTAGLGKSHDFDC